MAENIAMIVDFAKAQAELKPAELDSIGHHKNKYSSLAAIQRATLPIFTKHNFAICQEIGPDDDGHLYLTTSLLHITGLCRVSRWPLPQLDDIQKMGSYLTYAKRYSWAAICGISGDEDDDAEAAKDITPVQHKAKPKANKNGTPDSWAKLLDLVNERALVQYDAVAHMINAIIKEAEAQDIDLGKEPRKYPPDHDARRKLYKLAKDHADAKAEAPPVATAPPEAPPLFEAE